MTIYLPRALAQPYRSGLIHSALVRATKRQPSPWCDLRICAGGFGNSEHLGDELCKTVRLITREGKGRWSFGTIANHMTLSPLDVEHLARACGYESGRAMDERFSDVEPDQPLLKVTW